MRILICRADGVLEFSEIDGSLESMQEVVGGYIETVTFAEDCLIICNEEGAIRGLPRNRLLPGLCGDVFFCQAHGDELVGLSYRTLINLCSLFDIVLEVTE